MIVFALQFTTTTKFDESVSNGYDVILMMTNCIFILNKTGHLLQMKDTNQFNLAMNINIQMSFRKVVLVKINALSRVMCCRESKLNFVGL